MDPFLMKSLPLSDRFHTLYPENILGTDKYGHIVTCTRISKIKLDDLLTDFDAPTLQTFQALQLLQI